MIDNSSPQSAPAKCVNSQSRIADLEKALANQRQLLVELGAVVSDYRQRLKQAEAERDLLREASIALKKRLDDQAQAKGANAHPVATPHTLNTAEASSYTGLSRGRLNNLRFAGGGPSFLKLGHSVRYRIEDLDEWMNARLVENTSMLPTRK